MAHTNTLGLSRGLQFSALMLDLLVLGLQRK